MKTPFMWAGSKDKDYKIIKEYIPDFQTYYEPFVGGGSVYFRLLASNEKIIKAFISDVNIDLISTYEIIRDDPSSLIAGLPSNKDRNTYDALKSKKPTTKLETAIRFMYLNRNSFFGLGGWMKADRYSRETIIERINFFSPKMQNTTFSSNGCFTFTPDENSFVFVDPPYPNTANDSCYKIDNTEILELNRNYIKILLSSKSDFLFIVKWNDTIAQEFAKDNTVIIEKKEWIFRKPQQKPQKDYELYAYRLKNDTLKFYDFSQKVTFDHIF